jgi:hypothetical protein
VFTIQAYHNPYLQVGQINLQAIITVKVQQGLGLAPAPLSLAIALDRSGSMDGAKM